MAAWVARLPQRKEEEWYRADLIGLAAIDRHGERIGVVVGIHNFGAAAVVQGQVQPHPGVGRGRFDVTLQFAA